MLLVVLLEVKDTADDILRINSILLHLNDLIVFHPFELSLQIGSTVLS